MYRRKQPRQKTRQTPRQKTQISRFPDIVASLDVPDVPVFDCEDVKWRAGQEVLLLTAMQHFNANWAKVAEILTKHFGMDFTPEEVHDHYKNTYMEGPIADAMKNIRCDVPTMSLTDHTTEEHDEILEIIDFHSDGNVPEEFQKKIGYMPLREDYVVEPNATAELMIDDLDFTNKDEYVKNMYILLLDTYNCKIKERFKARELVKQYELVEQYYKSSEEYKKTHPKKDLNSLLTSGESSRCSEEDTNGKYENNLSPTEELSPFWYYETDETESGE